MSKPHTSLRTPLGKVRGLGAAKSGVRTWWLERMTSLALIPLSIWFLVAIISHLIGASRADAALWLSQPLVTLAMAALLVTLFWHTKLGLTVVVEDYVHTESRKLALLLFIAVACYGLLGLSLLALARLHILGI